MRKTLHRLWLIAWFLTLVLFFFIPITRWIDLDRLDTYYEGYIHTCTDELQRKNVKDPQLLEDCQYQKAYNSALYQAKNTRFRSLILLGLFVFVPYLVVGVVRWADGLIKEPNAIEDKIEEVLRKK